MVSREKRLIRISPVLAECAGFTSNSIMDGLSALICPISTHSSKNDKFLDKKTKIRNTQPKKVGRMSYLGRSKIPRESYSGIS